MVDLNPGRSCCEAAVLTGEAKSSWFWSGFMKTFTREHWLDFLLFWSKKKKVDPKRSWPEITDNKATIPHLILSNWEAWGPIKISTRKQRSPGNKDYVSHLFTGRSNTSLAEDLRLHIGFWANPPFLKKSYFRLCPCQKRSPQLCIFDLAVLCWIPLLKQGDLCLNTLKSHARLWRELEKFFKIEKPTGKHSSKGRKKEVF